MPRRNGKNETTTTRDQDKITLNKTILLGETKIRETKTPKGETITIHYDKGKKITLELTSLELFVLSMDIIFTISPKFPISNG